MVDKTNLDSENGFKVIEYILEVQNSFWDSHPKIHNQWSQYFMERLEKDAAAKQKAKE